MENKENNNERIKQIFKGYTDDLREILNSKSSGGCRCGVFVLLHIPFLAAIVLLALVFYWLELNKLVVVIPPVIVLVLSIILICVFCWVIWVWVRQIEKLKKQDQDVEKSWQTKLVDAYGKMLENQIRIENKKTENEMKEIEKQIKRKEIEINESEEKFK